MSFTPQAGHNVQREDLDTLQFAADPVERMLAGERLIASITADRNRALVAACAEYGRAAVADALGITRQAVYKRLQGATSQGERDETVERELIADGGSPTADTT